MKDRDKEYNCERRCGICCIVTTCIRLAKWEYKEGNYDTVMISKIRHKGWSRHVLRQKEVEIPGSGKVFACIYYDPKTKQCEIYDRRPWACRTFNCDDSSRFLKESTKELIENKKTWAHLYEEKGNGSAALRS